MYILSPWHCPRLNAKHGTGSHTSTSCSLLLFCVQVQPSVLGGEHQVFRAIVSRAFPFRLCSPTTTASYQVVACCFLQALGINAQVGTHKTCIVNNFLLFVFLPHPPFSPLSPLLLDNWNLEIESGITQLIRCSLSFSASNAGLLPSYRGDSVLFLRGKYIWLNE